MKAELNLQKQSNEVCGPSDTMLAISSAIRRAELPGHFPGGYSPHDSCHLQLLWCGTISGEYFDMELTEKVPTAEIEDRLNAVMVGGHYNQLCKTG